VVVRDTQPPTLTCPPDLTVTVDPGACVATGVALGSPIASDNCRRGDDEERCAAQFPVGTNRVTWTVTDANGNSATCPQRVVVRDTQAQP